MTNKPIFFDPTGRRARSVSWIGWSAAIATTLLAIFFVTTLLIVPQSPQLAFGRFTHWHALTPDKVVAPRLLKVAARLARKARAKQAGVPRSTHPLTMPVAAALGHPPKIPTSTTRPLAIGFYVNWDDSSYPALKRALPKLDWVAPSWLTLQGTEMALTVDVDRKALDLVRRTKPDTALLPMLQNATNAQWDGPGLARFLGDSSRRHTRIDEIVKILTQYQLQGIVIDFEDLPPAAHRNLLTFLHELKAAFAGRGFTLAAAVPFDDDAWNYPAIAANTDYLMLMAYDEHWQSGEAGSVASQDWFEALLAKRMKQLDPAHVIVCIGSYGYDWITGKPAAAITFQEAVLAARDSDAAIVFDDNLLNAHFSYADDNNKVHNVWLLDGVSAYNQIHAADDYRPAGYALWRLGSEDPTVWSLLGHDYGRVRPSALNDIAMGNDVDFEGTGEILQVAAEPKPGARTFELDPETGLISGETFTALPSGYVIRRVGAVPNKVALTFDDGPDPKWTPAILDILKAKHVKATFFIIGDAGEAYPEIVHRMVDEGHDVGNHTFTHPNLGEVSAGLTNLELNATQRLFEAITGRTMRLFRPPFFGDAEPTTADELIPVALAQALGYITVGLRVDPDDWQQPPAATIIERVLAAISLKDPERRGQIVLLHDSGGDRSHTIEALPDLIDAVRAKGYELVPVSTLAGLTPEQAMPVLPEDDVARAADRTVFFAVGKFEHGLAWLFRFAIGVGLLRVALLCALALWHALRPTRAPTESATRPLVTVLIPAFNEAKVIAVAVERILHSNYPNLDVIVIDDGSSDGTADVVRAAFASEPRVRLLEQPNSGKAHAVNLGLAQAPGEIIVALDADTQFMPDCIDKLVRWFTDPTIGAVAGNAKVGNRINTLTRWQAIEYITAQNLERRALAALGCITVVPGAVGAWRRSALEALGGFPGRTLAEDQDLTLALQRAGHHIVFDPEAIAWTEAPQTLRGLARQRFRWAYGTLQCLWQYRDMCLRPRYGSLGMVALPQAWLFQIFFGLVSPLVDLALLWQIGTSLANYLQHPAQMDTTNLLLTGSYYAVFTVVDIAAALVAFALEKKEDWRLLWWLVQQRFGYRQLMYYVVLKSVWTAIRGPAVGWGTSEREATVRTR